MRRLTIIASLLVLAFAAADAARPPGPAPAPSWPVDRFGRTMVPFIDGAQFIHTTVPAGGSGVIAQGHAMTGGWSSFTVTFPDYSAPTIDGIYEARLVGIEPKGMVTQQITNFASQPSGFPHNFTVRGFHVCARNACITVMADGSVIGGDGNAVMGKTGHTQ